MEEEKRERIEGVGRNGGGTIGEVERGKKKLKMLGTDFMLKQAKKGVGGMKDGKRRKRLNGKRRGGGGEKRSEEERVKEKEQAVFMDNWTRPKSMGPGTDNYRQGDY